MECVVTWRLPVAVAVLVVVAAVAAYLTFPRPPGPRGGSEIKLPAHRPADDASGAAGWHWPDGVPGWQAGQTIKGLNISGVQPIEVQAAQLAAARALLDPDSVRVLGAERQGYDGFLGILAAHTGDGWTVPKDPACLAAVFPGDAPVTWQCPGAFPDRPGDIARSHVFVAATVARWRTGARSLDLEGVARGDVERVVLVVPGVPAFGRSPLYVRGRTWGEFSSAVVLPRAEKPPRLLVYGHGRLLETVRLDLKPGERRVLG